MPIKVRCSHCQAVLSVSENASGRSIKCRECGGRIQVASRKHSSTGKRQRRQRPAGPDDLFARIDLDSVEDSRQKICPSCTVVVDQEDIICSNCGVDIDTGTLSERERLRRSRNTPPPENFYGDVWENAWQFLRHNTGWAGRTAVVWAITATVALCSVFILDWYIDGRAEELRNSGSGLVDITEERVFIDLRRDKENGEARYDGKRYTKSSVNSDLTLTLPGPQLGAKLSPPSLFWALIMLVSVLGFGGWAWTLTVHVILTTLNRGQRIKRFQTDLFAAMAMGFRSVFWPAVLLWPFLVVPFLIRYFTGDQNATVIAWTCIYLIPFVLFLPSALVHLTQEYTYRAWLLNWMSLDFIKTIVPTLYVSALMLGMVLLVPLTACILMIVFYDGITSYYTRSVEIPILTSLVGYKPETGGTFFAFTVYRLPLMATISFIGSVIVFGVLAFPAVFMMRIYGLFGYYFRPDLSLINQQTELGPVGCGPRFLALLIDSVLLITMAGIAWGLGTLSTKIFAFLYSFSEVGVLIGSLLFTAAFTLLLWGIYFASWESGQNRATLGKAALGIIVLSHDNQPVTLNQALGRAAACLVTVLTLFGGFASCVFHSQNRSLHDLITRTKVVWRGEGDQA